jgi:hypothetical protein
MAQIYVSYAEEGEAHRAWIRSLVRRLKGLGHAVAYLPDDVAPGDDLQAWVREAVARAQVALVVATPAYAARAAVPGSGVAHDLDRFALRPDLRIIPLLVQGDAAVALPGPLASRYALDLRDDRAFLARMQELDAVLERVGGGDRAPLDRSHRYVRRLELTNVKLAHDLSLSFEGADGAPRMWTCILGDNGSGKTSILQAIALAAMGESMASKLVDDARSYVTAGAPGATAAIATAFTGGLSTRLEVRPGSYQWVGAGKHDERVEELRRHRASGFFIAGFGTSRRLARPGQIAVPADPVAERVRGLFDADHRLLGLEFGEALEPQALKGAFLQGVTALLQEARDVESALLPGLTGLERAREEAPGARQGDVVARFDAGGGAFHVAPHLLSAGYQSVLAWVGELIGHTLLDAQRAVALAEIEGIVLIDEIDLHLHPTWQRRIVPILRRLLPRVQFIVTTHSPLVLAGCAPDEIVRLGLEEGAIRERPSPATEPRLSTATQVLSSWFDLPHAAPPGVKGVERAMLRHEAAKRRLPDASGVPSSGDEGAGEVFEEEAAFLKELLGELGS